MREGEGGEERKSSALSRSLGGTSRKVLLVLFVSFSASNSVLRLMRCHCFYPCYLHPTLSPPLFLSCSLSVCVWHFSCEPNPTKVKQSIRICCNCSTASTVSLVPSHFFHLCSILPPPLATLHSPLPPPGPPLTNLHVSFRWKITPFKNLLYVLPDFSFILFHVPHPYSFFSSPSSSSLLFSFVHSLV